MKKALIIGASSGIGKALAITLAKKNYEVGLMARRVELLRELQKELRVKTTVDYLDISQPDDAIERFHKMVLQMGGVDVVIINSGIRLPNSELDWQKERQTLQVNVIGFCALADASYHHFENQGHGQLVGISSIAALVGNHIAPAYNASKACISTYMEGLRKKAFREGLSLIITDIKPGYVDTDMVTSKKAFWTASASEAAEQIAATIENKKSYAYITHRWRLIGWLLKSLPNWIYYRY